MKANVDYDSEYDILYIYPKDRDTKVDFSIDHDDIILDVKGNKIIGVELMDASEKFVSDEESTERMKKVLASIKDAFISVKYEINSIRVKIGFYSEIPEPTREGLLIQIPIERELIVEV